MFRFSAYSILVIEGIVKLNVHSEKKNADEEVVVFDMLSFARIKIGVLSPIKEPV